LRGLKINNKDLLLTSQRLCPSLSLQIQSHDRVYGRSKYSKYQVSTKQKTYFVHVLDYCDREVTP
jgi:hypothetical protein